MVHYHATTSKQNSVVVQVYSPKYPPALPCLAQAIRCYAAAPSALFKNPVLAALSIYSQHENVGYSPIRYIVHPPGKESPNLLGTHNPLQFGIEVCATTFSQ